MSNILEIKNLSLSIHEKEILRDISLEVPYKAKYALIGESGSGKSITSMSILDLLPVGSVINSETEFYFKGENITSSRNKLRGKDITYIPQNPINSLNPIRTVYSQLSETIKFHQPDYTEQDIKNKCHELMDLVQLEEKAEFTLQAYAFELSGGMCQRILIAMALATSPELLIADEPTTALDVTTQREIMDLLMELIDKQGLSLLLITHDLALVSEYCDYISVLQNGRLVESANTANIINSPQENYTKQLIHCARELS